MSGRTIQTIFGQMHVEIPRNVNEMERQHQLMIHCAHTGYDCLRRNITSIVLRALRPPKATLTTYIATKVTPRKDVSQYRDVLGEIQDWYCNYCGKRIENGNHIDHMVPLQKGGSNDFNNLQLLCVKCNLRKGAKTELEYWDAVRGEYATV